MAWRKGGVILNNPPQLSTKFGNACVDTSGYYRITSRKEGNHHELLHRLIFREFYGDIPEGYIVHHKDENPFNNCILNLSLMSIKEHQNHHNIGNDEKHKKISYARNKTGFRNVSIQKGDSYKQGFTYMYRYYDNGKPKRIYSTTIEGLREKVLAKDLIWEEFAEAE